MLEPAHSKGCFRRGSGRSDGKPGLLLGCGLRVGINRPSGDGNGNRRRPARAAPPNREYPAKRFVTVRTLSQSAAKGQITMRRGTGGTSLRERRGTKSCGGRARNSSDASPGHGTRPPGSASSARHTRGIDAVWTTAVLPSHPLLSRYATIRSARTAASTVDDSLEDAAVMDPDDDGKGLPISRMCLHCRST